MSGYADLHSDFNVRHATSTTLQAGFRVSYPNIIDKAFTDNQAITTMRQVVKVGSYWLVFYKRSSDSYIVYRVSTDGIRWGDEKVASHAAAVGTSSYYDMGVEAKGTEIFIAYDLGSSSTSDMTVNFTYTRRGVFSAGSISWDAAVNMHTCGGYPYYCLVKTTNRIYLAIHAVMNASNPRYRVSVYYSTDNGATWTRILDKDTTLASSTTYASGIGMVWWPQYDDGIMVVSGPYTSSNYVYKTYTGAAWAATANIMAKTGSGYARFDTWSLATIGGKIHFVCLPSEAGGRLQYSAFVTSWTAAVYLDAAGVTSLAPTLAPRDDYLYLFNTIGGTIYYRRMVHASSSWSSAVSWIAGETSVARVNTPMFDEDDVGDSSICVIYRTAAAAPFTEKSALFGLTGVDLKAKFYVQIPFANLFARFFVQHPGESEDLQAHFTVRHSASQTLKAKFYVQQPFANLQAGFKVRNIGAANEQSRFISGNRTPHTFGATGFDDGDLGTNSHVVYANGRYWVFYRPATTGLAYKTSTTGGVTWETGATALGLSNTIDVVMESDNKTAHFASGKAGSAKGDVLYRKGTLNADGTITWAAAAQTVDTNARGNIQIDLRSGYPCLIYSKDTTENPPCYYYLAISSTNNGTFTHMAGSPWQVDSDATNNWGNYFVQMRALTNDLILLVRFMYDVTPGADPPKSRIFDPVAGTYTDWWVFNDGVSDVGFSSAYQNTIRKYGTNHAFCLCYALLPAHPVIRAWYYTYAVDGGSWEYIGQFDQTASAVAPVECPSASVAESDNFIACYWWNEASTKKFRRIWYTNGTLEDSNLEIQGAHSWDTDIGVLVATPRVIVNDVFSGVWFQTDSAGASEFFFDWLGGELGDHADLQAHFNVINEFSVDLNAEFITRHPGTAELKASFFVTAPASADLKAQFTVRNAASSELPTHLVIRRSASTDLGAEFQLQTSLDLFARFFVALHASAELGATFTVRHPASVDEQAHFYIRRSSSVDLKAFFLTYYTDSVALPSKFVVRRSSSAQLLAIANITHSVELKAVFTVQHSSTENLHAEAVIRHSDEAALFAKFTVRHSAAEDLGSAFTIRRSAYSELVADLIVRHDFSADLASEFIVKHSASAGLTAHLIIRHSADVNLPAELMVRSSGSADLQFALIVRNIGVSNLPAHLKVRHSASTNLKAIFELTRSADLIAEFYVRPDTLKGVELIVASNNRQHVGGNDRTFNVTSRRRIRVVG